MRHLLWVDCVAGAVVGVLVLVFARPLSHWEGLPLSVLTFTGAANLLYAAYSFSLAMRRERSIRLIQILVLANLAWAPVCLGLLMRHSDSATAFGLLHLAGEAVFVGGLAIIEWKNRDLLAT